MNDVQQEIQERFAESNRQAKLHVERHHKKALAKFIAASGLSWTEILSAMRNQGICAHAPSHIYPSKKRN
jgi:hypothetical protein